MIAPAGRTSIRGAPAGSVAGPQTAATVRSAPPAPPRWRA